MSLDISKTPNTKSNDTTDSDASLLQYRTLVVRTLDLICVTVGKCCEATDILKLRQVDVLPARASAKATNSVCAPMKRIPPRIRLPATRGGNAERFSNVVAPCLLAIT